MSAHTPAPWVIEADSGMSASYHMRRAVITSDEHEANARLIAAAPDLLDALLRLYEVSEGRSDAEVMARINASAAIAKATGSAA